MYWRTKMTVEYCLHQSGHAFVPKMHRFEMFNLYVYIDLETCARGHSRSSKTIPFNPAPITFY